MPPMVADSIVATLPGMTRPLTSVNGSVRTQPVARKTRIRAKETWKAKPIIGQTGIRPNFPLFDTGLGAVKLAFASNNRNRANQWRKGKRKRRKKYPP